MPNKCFVVGCNSGYRNGPDYPRFKFPQKQELVAKWLIFLNRPADYIVTNNYFICSQHFDPSYLKVTDHIFTRLNYDSYSNYPSTILTPQSLATVPTKSRPPSK